MKTWLSNFKVYPTVLIILALRALYSMDIAQAIVFVAFSAFVAYIKWLDMNKKQDLSEEVKAELEKMKSIISSLAIKNAAKSAQEGKRFF